MHTYANKAIALAFKNKQRCQNSLTVGCYYCHSVYSSSEISEYCDAGQTALCAKCGIDAVVPETPEVPLNSETLKEIGDILFSVSTGDT